MRIIYLLKVAWRNLSRNKVRTFVSVLAITAVVMIVIFARGLMLGFTESNFQTYIDNSFGHVRITEEEYQIREALLPLEYTVDGFAGAGKSEMISEIKTLDRVEHVLPRIRFGAMASIDDRLIRMSGVGIDTAAENEYGALKADLKEGRMPESDNEIYVGSGLMEKLNADLGDRVTFSFADAYQSLRGRSFKIVGVRESGVVQLDDNFFYLPLSTAQDMLWMENEATELLVFAADAQEAERLQTDINTLLSEKNAENYTSVIWNKADPLIEIYNEVGNLMNLVYVLFILLGTIVVTSSLNMIIRERTSEIGMMAALGLKEKEIMKIFVYEGSFMGVIGSLMGVIGGGIITFYYSIEGIYVDVFADAMKELDVLVEPVFYLIFNFENLLISFVLGVVVVTLACLFPAYKAAKMDPVDALHYIDE
ncbi:ABC transporter permease [Halanaerobium hydrogeniformans]|uniref:ABC3 transporter permease protein domain-containing protein n=1 Tax=Halanaerobium hydrogeniformans TaxID=656519 RepID=E4RNU1_HALHG|nr:FtsX-like permease family protein [Halanaerobium hydrogeniformans]ADQ13769.1 protein of unknown function DUF214 [Halanaerobium hydrogeniformans]